MTPENSIDLLEAYMKHIFPFLVYRIKPIYQIFTFIKLSSLGEKYMNTLCVGIHSAQTVQVSGEKTFPPTLTDKFP